MTANAFDGSSSLPLPRRLPQARPATVVGVLAVLAAATVPPMIGDFASFVGARIAVTAIIGLYRRATPVSCR